MKDFEALQMDQLLQSKRMQMVVFNQYVLLTLDGKPIRARVRDRSKYMPHQGQQERDRRCARRMGLK